MLETIVSDKIPKIVVVNGDNINSFYCNKDMILGRDTANNKVDISIPLNFISRRHGLFSFDENGVFYIDTNSSYGSYINRVKLETNKKYYLNDGDIITICVDFMNFNSDLISIIFMKDYPMNFEFKTVKFPESEKRFTIGRSNDNDIVLISPIVSSKHAILDFLDNSVRIVDNDSSNGVYVNGAKRNSYDLNRGDIFRISNIYFIIFKDKFVYSRSKAIVQVSSTVNEKDKTNKKELLVDIKHRAVRRFFRKRYILKDVKFNLSSYEMVLVLGGSGAGKTTLINAIMGYEKANASILYDGIDVYKNYEVVKNDICFVPQKNLIREGDNVYDTLSNALTLKNIDLSPDKKEQKIDDVLNSLGLINEKKHLVSKLSGGQKKRLSIAVEYISNPKMFFLDEPDSGLDGAMSRQIFLNLRNIANEGKMIMVISHSPDRVSDLFDKVLVLAKSNNDNCGTLAYYGSVSDTLNFFEVYNLEDAVKRVKSLSEGGEGKADYYIEKFKNNKERV